MSKSRLVPWLGFGAVLVGVAFLWHGDARRPNDKAAPTERRAGEAAGVDPTRLIVDFRDDVSPETLANNGFTEIPVSDYSATDRLYRMDFATAAEAAAATAKLSHDPERRERRLRVVGEHPARRGIARGPGGGEPRVRLDGGGVPGGRRRHAAFPNDACYKYQWHMRQIGMPDAWKLGNGKGVVVAVIDTGVTKVGDLAETKFVAGYNFVGEQRQRRRRPRPRHARRRDHRAVDQQQARRRGRRAKASDHAAQGAVGARLGLDGRHRAGASAGPPTTARTSST